MRALGLETTLFAAGANELPIWQLYSGRIPDKPHLWETDPVNPLPEVTVPIPPYKTFIAEAANAGAAIYRPAKARLIPGNDPPEIEVTEGDRPTLLKPRLIVGADGRTRRFASG